MRTKYSDEMTDMFKQQINAIKSVSDYFETKGFDNSQLNRNVNKLKRTLRLYVKNKTKQETK